MKNKEIILNIIIVIILVLLFVVGTVSNLVTTTGNYKTEIITATAGFVIFFVIVAMVFTKGSRVIKFIYGILSLLVILQLFGLIPRLISIIG